MLAVPDDLAPRAVLAAVHRGPEGEVAAEARVGGEEAGAVPGLVRPAPEVGLPALTNHSSPAAPLHQSQLTWSPHRSPGSRWPRAEVQRSSWLVSTSGEAGTSSNSTSSATSIRPIRDDHCGHVTSSPPITAHLAAASWCQHRARPGSATAAAAPLATLCTEYLLLPLLSSFFKYQHIVK